ncbi:MAG TPA: chorismate synthase [Ktedonobacteraceae bacterium]|nr:chorismate synthase [Ktedonobacteraceae bacterium]
MFRFLTSGESHGPGLTAIVEGIPAGLPLSTEDIDPHLERRQGGYGRGGRMKIEKDKVIFRSGVRHGLTLGSPITLEIENRDWQNWQVKMSATPVDEPVEAVTLVRPGHADFAGTIKYGHQDIRNVIERSSARETAARVAVGAVCQTFLRQFGVEIHSHVLSIGSVGDSDASRSAISNSFSPEYWQQVEQSPVRCGDSELTDKMIRHIQMCKSLGETCGGVFEVVATGVPIGLGSYSQWDHRLSTRLAAALMSIPSVKGVEIGAGFASAALPGSQVHDVVQWSDQQGWQHLSNNAGGIEGGISNGAPIVLRAAVKPISTLAHPLPTIDIRSRENVEKGRYERSDVCIVPAAGVVGEAMLAIALTEAWREKFGGDSMAESLANYNAYIATTGAHPQPETGEKTKQE